MKNGGEVPENRVAKGVQSGINNSHEVLNGKKKTTSEDWQPKFPLWGKGGLMSPWEAAKRAELISGGKEERGRSRSREPRSDLKSLLSLKLFKRDPGSKSLQTKGMSHGRAFSCLAIF